MKQNRSDVLKPEVKQKCWFNMKAIVSSHGKQKRERDTLSEDKERVALIDSYHQSFGNPVN